MQPIPIKTSIKITTYQTDPRKGYKMKYTANGKTHGAGCDCPKCRTADTKEFITSLLKYYADDLTSLHYTKLEPEQARVVDNVSIKLSQLRDHLEA